MLMSDTSPEVKGRIEFSKYKMYRQLYMDWIFLYSFGCFNDPPSISIMLLIAEINSFGSPVTEAKSIRIQS